MQSPVYGQINREGYVESEAFLPSFRLVLPPSTGLQLSAAWFTGVGMVAAKEILVVEDHADVRDSLMLYLEQLGLHALGAQNGQDALDLLRRGERPCLILLDLMMPVMDGWQFRERQLQDPQLAPIPVVLVTARNDVPAITRRLGVAAALHKPIDFDELGALVERYCAVA